MLTYNECLEMCDLTPEEIDAIAEHEHVDPIIAMALGHYLVTHQGENRIKSIILDDIEHARGCGNHERVILLRKTLLHFMATHPDPRITGAA
ncbi:hypothetical protein [Nitrincola sp. MINF-07-Sa-05]|uniref:hypothetical protein n=1 Tax=Nitrincola salilacus TaxID=3400273 RepID=UPI0039185224